MRVAGANLTCQLQINNTGNVALVSVAVQDQAACSSLPGLPPGGTTSCTVSWQIPQAEFDNWDSGYAFKALGTLKQGVTIVADAVSLAQPGRQGGLHAEAVTTVEVALISRPNFTVVSTSVSVPQTGCFPGMPYQYCSNPMGMANNMSNIVPGRGHLSLCCSRL